MDASGVGWVGLIVAVLIFLDLLFVELRRIYREAMRLTRRLMGYTELPIFSMLVTAGDDAERIARAVDALGDLIARAQAAGGVLSRYIPKGSSPG